MADFVLNLNNFIIQQLMKGDNSQINIHIEQSGGSLGGDLASWSTFALYGITILLMLFTGGYYINVQQTDTFKWREKNTYIVLPLALNGYFLIVLTIDILVCKCVCVIILFGVILLLEAIYKKRSYVILLLFDFIIYCFIEIIFFYSKNNQDMYIFWGLIFIIILFGNFLFMEGLKEKLYPLKEYIVYLTDQKCYSGKLESIKEGFLVLRDVELYNRKVSKRSIYKPENKSFDIKRIQNISSEKKILEKTMIIPREQVLSMYVIDEENKIK